MTRCLIVDGGWGGHRLALISSIIEELTRRNIDTSIILATEGRRSNEFAAHLKEVRVEATVTRQTTGAHWWMRALHSVPNDVDLVIIPKCDNIVRYHACVNFITEARWATSGLLLKVAPHQQDYLAGSIAQDRARRLKHALGATRRGAIDQLALLCGYGDDKPGVVPGNERLPAQWVQDVPLLQATLPSLPLVTNHPYALVAGEISWRKRVPELLHIWPTVFKNTGIALALIGPLHDSVRHDVLETKLSIGNALITRDAYVSNSELANWYRNAAVVLGTFDSGQYAPSGAVAIAQNLGVPIVSFGNTYVDRLLRQLGGAEVLDSITASSLSAGIASALDRAPVPTLVNGRRDALARFIDTLLIPLNEVAW